MNKFENISNDDIECAKEIAENIKNKYINSPKDLLYYRYLSSISDNFYKIENKDMLPLVLIMTIDPSMNIYKIYEKYSRFNEIKSVMRFVYGFDDLKIIKFEKAYIQKFLDMDDFDFVKRLEI